MNLPVILVLFLLGLNSVAYGFLLEKSTPAGNTAAPLATDYQYFNELLRDEKQHRYQLEKRVAALEQKTGSHQQDDKINQLEQYVLTLESRVKFLEENQVVPVNETIDKFARSEIVKESGIYQQQFVELEKKYNALQQTHATTMNALADFQKKVSDLEQLKSVNQTQMLQNLEHKYQDLNSKTNMLVNNGNARSQDFLALYNKTISVEKNAKHMIENVAKNLNDSSVVLEAHMINLEQLQNTSTTKLRGVISGEVIAMQKMILTMDAKLNSTKQTTDSRSRLLGIKVTEMENRQNSTNKDILTKITDNSRKVAVSSCIQSGKQFSNGEVIKFSNVKMSSGVSNLSAFKSTGKFTCEYPGLYHVTVTISISASYHLYVSLMKNNAEYITLYDESSKGARTSTDATTLTLDTNDTVYIKVNAYSPFLYGSDWSCMSITKIK